MNEAAEISIPDGVGERALSVLQVLPALHGGGVERGACDIASAIARRGWASYVVSAGGPMTREFERAGVRHFTQPVDSKNPLVMRANVDRLARLIVDYDIDIVHARSRAPAWSAWAAARRTNTPFVTTFHGTYSYSNPLKKRYNAIMTRGARVIAISEFIAEHLRRDYRVDEARLVTVPRGVNLKQFDPVAVSAERMIQLAAAWRLQDGEPVIMLPGRITSWKGQEVMVEALARLGRKDIRCLLIGEHRGRESYRRRLERRIAQHGLTSVVAIVGPCNDMPAAYKLADVVVSASTEPEAFGRVAAEAQAMGRPVIATDHGAARETVRHGETAWLVPPRDPAALAGAIAAALALPPDVREAVAVAARRHIAERFSVDDMCEATLAIYASLAGAA